MARTILTLTVFVLLLCVLLALRITPWFPADDAFISYRYAAQWADGYGPVFNPGERVEGYSNFLFVALLAAASRLGVTPPLAGRILNVAGAVAVLFLLLYALPGRLRHSKARYVAALIFVASYHTLVNVLSGLEAPVVAALLLAGVLGFESRRRIVTPLSFLAIGLCRPEGIALGAVAGGADIGRALWNRDRREGRRAVLAWTIVLAVPYALYLVWRMSYYGQILPNSVFAKMGFPPGEELKGSLSYMKPALATYWPLIALAGIGWLARGWLGRQRREGTASSTPERWGVLLLFLSTLGIVLRTGSGDPYLPFLRYLFPALPLLLVLAVVATDRLLDAAGPGRLVVIALAVGLWGAQLVLAARPVFVLNTPPKDPFARVVQGFEMLTRQDRHPHDVRIPGVPLGVHAAAAWMVDHAHEDEWLATAEVGIVPYYSGVQVIDTFGLITDHIARLPGRPGFKSDPDFVYGRDPDYFIFKKLSDCLCSGIPADVELFRDPRLRRGYDFVRMFHDGGVRVLLFKKRPAEEQPSIAYDFCTSFNPERVVVRDQAGRPIEQTAGLRSITDRRIGEVVDEARRKELLDLLQPAIRGEVADFEAKELMREWLGRWGCYVQQLPVVPSRYDVAIHYDVAIPERAELSFKLSLPSDPRNLPQGPDVVFDLHLEDAVGEVTTLFHQTVSVDDIPFWKDYRIDLSPFSGQRVELSLRVHQDDAEASQRSVYNAGWMDMLLSEKDGGGSG